MESLPMYLIRPGLGRRLPPREKFQKEEDRHSNYRNKIWHSSDDKGGCSVVGAGLVPPPRNWGIERFFPNQDFRFWRGFRPGQGPMSSCRRCRTAVFTPEARTLHLRSHNCRAVLSEAYKLLKLDHKCVICDTHTYRFRWGIPICSVGCEDIWSYDSVIPDSLREAIRLVEKSREKV